MCEKCAEAGTISRRFVLGGALAMAAMAQSARADITPGAPNAIPPNEALQRLLDGNRRYAANTPANQDYSRGRTERASAQYPIAAVLSCSDSRVAPEILFDQGPGQIFVVRVAGNFVSAEGLASLEYAVQFLGVPLVFVLGHSGCGAVAAAIKVLQEGVKLPGSLPGLIAELKPAVHAAMAQKPADLLAAATRENVRLNMSRLRGDTPVLSEAVARGTVQVSGGIYDIATGTVTL
jgi:carbonic anhydrase